MNSSAAEAQDFALPRTAVAEAEREIDESDIEAEKPADRPCADRHEADADRQADKPEQQHQDVKPARRQAAVRQQHALEKDIGTRAHSEKIGCADAARQAVRAAPLSPPSARAKPKRARPFSKAEIEEFYRRLSASRPIPQTELEFINPYTLLVAVVLSAQATDVGVNRATPALFAVADTPQKMLELGEERLVEFIRTIGLFRTKARNIIKLSRILIDEHGGEVPRQREALEKLPGVGRKTANVVLNVAFGEPTIAVDTHIFRVGNRTGIAPGKTPRRSSSGLEAVTPAHYKLGAHHWLILHGRYVCKARKPECPVCVVADLCRYGDKTPPRRVAPTAERAQAVTAEPLSEPKRARVERSAK